MSRTTSSQLSIHGAIRLCLTLSLLSATQSLAQPPSDFPTEESLPKLQNDLIRGSVDRIAADETANKFGLVRRPFSLLSIPESTYHEMFPQTKDESDIAPDAEKLPYGEYVHHKLKAADLDHLDKVLKELEDGRYKHYACFAEKNSTNKYTFADPTPANHGQPAHLGLRGQMIIVADEIIDEGRFITANLRVGSAKCPQIKFEMPTNNSDHEFSMVAVRGGTDRIWLLTARQEKAKSNQQADVSVVPVTVASRTASSARQSPAATATRISKNISLSVFEAKVAEIVKVAELLNQPIDLSKNQIAAINISKQHAELISNNQKVRAIEFKQQWQKIRETSATNGKREVTFRPRRTPNESRWKVKPRTTTVQLDTVETIGPNKIALQHDVTIALSGKLDVDYRYRLKLNSDNQAFVVLRQDKDTCLVVGLGRDMSMKFSVATARTQSEKTLPAPPKPRESTKLKSHDVVYETTGTIVEMNDAAIALLNEALSQDSKSLASRASVISGSDADHILQFIDEQTEQGNSRMLSRPTLRTMAHKRCEVQIGQKAPVVVHVPPKSKAIEFKPIGLYLGMTCSPFDKQQTLIQWRLSRTAADVRGIVADGVAIPSYSSQIMEGTSRLTTEECLLLISPSVQAKTEWLVTLLVPTTVNEVTSTQPVASAPVVPGVSKTSPGAEPIRSVGVKDAAGTSRLSSPILIKQISAKEIQIEDQTQLTATDGETWTLKCASRIKQVKEFDSEVMSVEPVDGDPCSLTLNMLNEGATAITVTDENGFDRRLRILIRGRDGGLSLHLKRLYPALSLEVWSIKGAALLRGKVENDEQREQIVSVAKCVFASILDQLEVDPLVAAHDSENTQREMLPGGTFTVGKNTPALFLKQEFRYTIRCPKRIKSVADFTDVVRVEPISNDPTAISVYGEKIGTTGLTIGCEDGTFHKLDFAVEQDVSNLAYTANALYPHLQLSFFPIASAIVVRGTVNDARQENQIIELSEQYYPCVLNQLIIGPSRRNGHAATTMPKVHPVSHSREIDSIRTDIKTLHGYVRELIELLQQRK